MWAFTVKTPRQRSHDEAPHPGGKAAGRRRDTHGAGGTLAEWPLTSLARGGTHIRLRHAGANKASTAGSPPFWHLFLVGPSSKSRCPVPPRT